MPKRSHIIRFLLFIACQLSLTAVMAQTYTRPCEDRKLVKTASKWLKKSKWAGAFDKARPHASVNAVDFYEQYQKNPEQWKALFLWLQETDLLAIDKGKHPIKGTTLIASVEDSSNGPLAKRNSESHYHHIDFQYVVKGVERFGIIDHETSVPKDEYKPDVIHYNYDVTRALFYDSTPDEFFIFFPSDWHIAKVEVPEREDQTIRVIVIKVDYIE